MTTRYYNLPGTKLEPAEKILKAAIHSWTNPAGPPLESKPRVFVTVARQPGAGAVTFSHRLAARLNREGEGDWSAWDRELVERVSVEHGIARDIIEMIPNRHRNWLEEFLQSLSASEIPPDLQELRAYKRVAMTIRALASAGHAIIVGMGGMYITQRMPAAIHIRLVAPLDYRIKSTVEREKISLHDAAARVAEIERRRTDFYRRYWPGKVIGPETFTMTLNSAELSLDELVECVLPVIRMRETTETCHSVRQEAPVAAATSVSATP
jgi:cytidylate kinase